MLHIWIYPNFKTFIQDISPLFCTNKINNYLNCTRKLYKYQLYL
nr:MAG TPA: hypothetical protein [Herelleviridae sp.]